MTIVEQVPRTEALIPRYDLDEQERNRAIMSTLTYLGGSIDRSATNVIIAGGDSGIANYVRTMEAEVLPTVPSVMQNYESTSKFVVVLQDADEITHEIDPNPAHVFRVNMVDLNTRVDRTDMPVGLPTFDDVLKMGLATEEELLDFYGVSTLQELGNEYLNVESNIANKEVKTSMRKPYSAFGYKALFELAQYEQKRGVVAYQNIDAMTSLGRIGVRSMPLIGNPELSIENEDKQKADGSSSDKYFPLTVEISPFSKVLGGLPEHNSRIFTDVAYANSMSKIAGLIASRHINIINIF